MKLNEIALTEAEQHDRKVEYIAKAMEKSLVAAAHEDSSYKNHGEADSHHIVAELVKADPTPDKKALNFLARMYSMKQFKMEDLDRVKTDVAKFYEVQPKLENKDLNNYKTLKQMYDVLKPFQKKKVVSHKEEMRTQKMEGADYIINSPTFKVIVPKTFEAACLYGMETKWCTTTSEETFKSYHNRGNLYIISAKDPKGGVRKYQLHIEDGAFKDETDSDLSKNDVAFLSSFPQYQEFLDYLEKRHYINYVENAEKKETKKKTK